MESANIQLSVVAPVYNEAEGIEGIIRSWVNILSSGTQSWEIVVTDDGSTDQTRSILERLASEFPGFRFVGYSPNRGYGYALKTAIYATKGDWVVTLDSDGQFDLSDSESLFKVQQQSGLDFVTGYRLRKKDSFVRVFADRTLNKMVRAMFHVPFRDTNCAMKLIRGDLARQLNIESNGYPTPTEITIKLFVLGARSGETGVKHLERLAGQSKLRILRTSMAMSRFLWYLRKKVKLYRAGVVKTL
ncbi:MAG TPA: glycosyltransferase family 2 protein [Acidobacteriota bacterium]|nr:glycosyltransferase family 2 protein [Acidobacteriota bacterium]